MANKRWYGNSVIELPDVSLEEINASVNLFTDATSML